MKSTTDLKIEYQKYVLKRKEEHPMAKILMYEDWEKLHREDSMGLHESKNDKVARGREKYGSKEKICKS